MAAAILSIRSHRCRLLCPHCCDSCRSHPARIGSNDAACLGAATPGRSHLCQVNAKISRQPRVIGVGLGNMGAPLTGRIAAKFPTAVYDLNAAAVAKHNEQLGSTGIDGVDTLHTLTATADVIVTCLPNTNLTRVTLDTLRPALREGTVWLDATSGRGEDAAALAEELL